MSPALTLPLVGLLIGLPGIPGFNKIPKFRHEKAAVDSLPPAWKSHSLLTLENQFLLPSLPPIGPPGVRLKVTNDPRRLLVEVDSDSGTVTSMPALGEVALAEGARVPMEEFHRELIQQSFRRLWADRSRQSVNAVVGASDIGNRGAGGGYQFNLPVHLPSIYHSFLGPGGPAINVSGSENVKLAGTSEWSNQQTGLIGQKRSLFPSLDMEQDLDIRLEGQLSDRVKVNLLQNSATQIPLANKIAINYRGEEDDLVQSLDLGNTNLTLPGTQYVSYSGRNEGLFGMKATTRMGPLDFTILASKQEGKSERASYAGGASAQTQTLNDYDYVRGVYFLLYDPNVTTQEIDEQSIHLYLDDGTSTASRSEVTRARAVVDPETACIESLACVPTTPFIRSYFSPLTQGPDKDFEVLNDVYGPRYKVIRLKRPISGETQMLAVSYRYRRVVNGQPIEPPIAVGGDKVQEADGDSTLTLKLLRAPLNRLPPDDSGNFDNTSDFAATRELELHNFYQLAGQGIDSRTFSLSIRHGVDNPPITVIRGANGEPIPYIEILGLDNYDETTGTPVFGKHDNKVDGSLPFSLSRLFVDFKNGTLFFLDPRPFAPRVAPVDSTHPFDQFLSDQLFRREKLTGAPGDSNEANPPIYDKRNNVNRALDSRYYIDLEFTATRAGNEINLGRSNIIEGSEAVTIDGRRLDRDKDYTIDYDLGRVTLKSQPSATAQVSVDYSYAPLFQQTSRTLVGSAFRLSGTDRNLGGAFMYESKGAQDLRPRLGEEPSRVLIGDLNGEWRMHPQFLTRWVDALPGVRTTAPSEFNVSAEVGASFPNPNTFNEVFIDDMEGVRDAVSLSMTPDHWTWSSQPSRMVGTTIDSIEAHEKNAEVHWFTPINSVKEHDLKPNLSDAQGGSNSRQVLAISVPRRPPAYATSGDSLWVGLTYLLDGVGTDLARSQFIELWVNDFNNGSKVPQVPGQSVKLHLDLGTVSEDQRRSPGQPANGVLDTEDRLGRDQKLTVTDPEHNEDTGMDGVIGAAEVADPNLLTSGPTDPAGDNFVQPNVDNERPINNLDPKRWLYTNGTEDNKNVFPIPDTEDLNRNDIFETQQDYFEYTIDLADTTYLADKVLNGWKRYRIPITDDRRVKFGSPDLSLTRHLRVWLDGIMQTDDVDQPGDHRPLVLLGGVEIVGSRWLTTDLTSSQVTAGTTLTLNSVNNVDNADIYVAPFDPGSTRNGSQDLARREQSLELEFTQFQPDDTLEVFKTFSLDEDYTRYGTLRFYVAGFEVAPPNGGPPADDLYYFVRFASDERSLNYYEYRAPVPPSSTPRNINWSEVFLKLTALSNLKILYPDSTESITAPGPNPGSTLIVKGRPSFTRLRRLSTGLMNRSATNVYPSGRLWVDEVRASDVARDHGRAGRVSVSGRMANLFGYNVNYSMRDQDFLQVGESRGSGNRNSNWNIGTNFDLHRFFAGTGIVIPLTYNLSGNRAQPRYTAGDDVVRTGALASASESRTDTRSWTASYSRTWGERSNPFLRYTIGGITANMSRTASFNSNPSSVDTTHSNAAAVSYSISPRRLLPIVVPGTKFRVYPLPERFFWNYAVTNRDSRFYDRQRDGSLVLRNSTTGRAAGIDFGADSRPIDLLQHSFQARRNLTLPEPLMEHIGPINLGKVVQWNQSFSSRLSPNRGNWLRPQLSWNSTYYQNNGPELSPNLVVRAVNNGESFNVGWTLPFDQLATTSRTARRDTVRRGTPAWKRGLSHLGAFSMDAGVTRSSAYTRLTGTPSIPYLIGISNDPGLSPDSTGPVQAQFGNTATATQDWRAGARTRLILPRAASIQANGDISYNRRLINNLVNRSRRVGFPSFDMDYGRLPEWIGLKHLFTNPKLRTVYSRNSTTEYANSNTPTNLSTSVEWRPLLGLTGDFKNGTRAELRVQRRGTETQYRIVGLSTTTDDNTDVDLTLSRSYTKGQKVTFLGKANTVKTNITLGLTGAYSRRNSESKVEGLLQPLNKVAEDRLNVNARGSYGFSTNVTGNAELGFSQTRDLQTDITRRSMRVELRAQFTF